MLGYIRNGNTTCSATAFVSGLSVCSAMRFDLIAFTAICAKRPWQLKGAHQKAIYKKKKNILRFIVIVITSVCLCIVSYNVLALRVI